MENETKAEKKFYTALLYLNGCYNQYVFTITCRWWLCGRDHQPQIIDSNTRVTSRVLSNYLQDVF